MQKIMGPMPGKEKRVQLDVKIEEEVDCGDSPNDEYGVELVRRGFVVLAPPYPMLANYQPDVRALGWRSGTLKGVWDNMRGLDLLSSLPFVRTNRGFGAIG